MNYKSIKETADAWGISPRRVQTLCTTGRIPGAKKVGRNWAIPDDTARPKDRRAGTGDSEDWRKKSRKKSSVKNYSVDTQAVTRLAQEIHTSLNDVLGFSGYAQRHLNDTAHVQECLDNIQTSSRHLVQIADNVVQLLSLQNGTNRLQEEVCNVEKALKGMREHYAAELTESKAKVIVDKQITHEFVWIDRNKVYKIFDDIFRNIMQSIKEAGKIRISVEELHCDRKGYYNFRCVIEVSGVEYSENIMACILENFSREKVFAENISSNNGLELAIVRRLVELMEGDISARRISDGGLRLMVTIPFKIAELTDYVEGREDGIDLLTLAGRRILIAEDNELNLEMIQVLLKEAGFEVESAKDGIVCVAMYETNPADYYDVILMDIEMPNLNGIKATEIIRNMSDAKLAKIPIIAMTAKATPEDKQEALSAGMNGFVGKPIDINELLRAISNVLTA